MSEPDVTDDQRALVWGFCFAHEMQHSSKGTDTIPNRLEAATINADAAAKSDKACRAWLWSMRNTEV